MNFVNHAYNYYHLNMGGKTSKKVDNTGTVVNEVTIQPATIENNDIILLLYVLTIISVLNFLINAYKMWRKSLKKQYLRRGTDEDKI